MTRDRYAQCDETCTADCGACKGAGRPADMRRDLVDLLVAHQRQGAGGGCHCGAVALGESYPEHIADLVLAQTPPEVVAAGERVERVTRALWEQPATPSWRSRRVHGEAGGFYGLSHADARRLAAAAIAADPSPAEVELWRCVRCHRAPEQHAGGRESGDCVYAPELTVSTPSPAEEAVKRLIATAPTMRFDNGYPVKAVPISELLSVLSADALPAIRAALASPAPAPQDGGAFEEAERLADAGIMPPELPVPRPLRCYCGDC